MSVRSVRGTHDLLGEDMRRHRFIVQSAQKLAENYGFSEISTPIFEFTEVFKRSLGDASDIVGKEMYTFEDRGGESITLRPEGTAAVARAFLSEGLSQHLPLKLFYQGPMFRYERPQKGRQRQFHQLGVEFLGIANPIADIECIALGAAILEQLGLSEKTYLEINTIGDSESRQAYRKALVDYFSQVQEQLSADSQRRLTSNPLRILDSKDEKDRPLVEKAPSFEDYLNQESKDIFARIQQGLDKLGVAYTRNPRMVRGLDYYSHCVFEFKTKALGAQDAVLSGGRYDGLIETMGGPHTPGCGWAAGIERLSLLLDKGPEAQRPLAIIALGEEAELGALKVADDLRRLGHLVEMTYSGNMGKRMKKANKMNAKAALILGSDELRQNLVTLKNFDSGEQKQVPLSELASQITGLT